MRKSVFTTGMAAVFAVMAMTPAFAGDPNTPTGAPGAAASAMFTLESIYQRLATGAAGAKRVAPFAEPSAGPGAMGHTLDEVMGLAPAVDNTNGATEGNVMTGKTFWGLTAGAWGLKTGTLAAATNPAPVPKTGQTACYDNTTPTPVIVVCPFAALPGQDGDNQKGVTLPNPRFTDNGDGTVKDNLTGLIWLKNANCFSTRTWAQALTDAAGLASGSCGLTDGSTAGQWRLPNKRELFSLTHDGYSFPSLTNDAGDAKWGTTGTSSFTNVQTVIYWSATTYVGSTTYAWYVALGSGTVSSTNKSNAYYVWPVR